MVVNGGCPEKFGSLLAGRGKVEERGAAEHCVGGRACAGRGCARLRERADGDAHAPGDADGYSHRCAFPFAGADPNTDTHADACGDAHAAAHGDPDARADSHAYALSNPIADAFSNSDRDADACAHAHPDSDRDADTCAYAYAYPDSYGDAYPYPHADPDAHAAAQGTSVRLFRGVGLARRGGTAEGVPPRGTRQLGALGGGGLVLQG